MMDNVYYSVRALLYSMYTVQFVHYNTCMYNIHSVHCSLIVHCIKCSVQCVECIVYTIHYTRTVHTVKCLMYHFTAVEAKALIQI